jgi:hypothetical protein
VVVQEQRVHRHRFLRLARLIVLLLVAAAAWPATSAASGRPDIDEVVVSRDRAGTLTFAIKFASAATLGTDTKLQVMLDTDGNSSTGSEGAEYALDYSAAVDGMDPTPALLVAGEGESMSAPPDFSSTPSSATFRIPVNDVGDPDSFDFWVFVEVSGDLVETAPTHVMVSTSALPWTYPKDGAPETGQPYPTDTYEDLSDTSLETSDIPWLLILLGIAGAGALVGASGWAYERYRNRRWPQPKDGSAGSPPPGTNGHAGSGAASSEIDEGTPAPELKEQLVAARELMRRKEPRKALDVVERVRARAVAARDVPGVVGAWSVAAGVYQRSSGKVHQRAGRIAFDCQQNVRSLSRGRAADRGEK